MNINKDNRGFGVAPLLVVIALIGLLVLAGVRISNDRSDKSTGADAKPASSDIKSTSDDLDSVKIDEDLDSADLDKDIEAVL